MHVNCDHMSDTDSLQQVGDHARRDRLAATMSLVSPRISEVRYDGCNALGGCAAAGIGKGQQFNEMVIDGGDVAWTIKTLRPRTGSSSRIETSPSGNRSIPQAPTSTPNARAIASAKCRLAEPAKMVKLSGILL
jgi:hypothetical protein